MKYLGIDLGGTNIVAGVVDENYAIIAKAQTKTTVPRPEDSMCDDMARVAKEALELAGVSLEEIAWLGIGTPGTVNRDTGVVEYANNLRYHHWAIVEMMKERLPLPVIVENDANAAAYGEFLAGAARGSQNAIVVTLGTGVGSGIIIDGKIYSGSNFAGAEMGHTVIVVGGRECTCGRRGCWEAYASATGLIALTKEEMLREQSNPDSVMWKLAEGNINNVNGRTSFDAMRAGDPAGKSVVDRYIDYLACGLVNAINIFQPDVICLGCGISKEGETLLRPLRSYIERDRYSKYAQKQTKICRAELGNDAGIIGAALLGKLYE